MVRIYEQLDIRCAGFTDVNHASNCLWILTPALLRCAVSFCFVAHVICLPQYSSDAHAMRQDASLNALLERSSQMQHICSARVYGFQGQHPV